MWKCHTLLQFTFALKSEVATKKGSRVLVEKMDLAFDENEEAVRWRQALAEQVDLLVMSPT